MKILFWSKWIANGHIAQECGTVWKPPVSAHHYACRFASVSSRTRRPQVV